MTMNFIKTNSLLHLEFGAIVLSCLVHTSVTPCFELPLHFSDQTDFRLYLTFCYHVFLFFHMPPCFAA